MRLPESRGDEPVDRATRRSGWTRYGGASRKWHWTDDADGDGRSLCGKWARNPFAAAIPLPVEADSGPSQNDCAACRRKKDARDA